MSSGPHKVITEKKKAFWIMGTLHIKRQDQNMDQISGKGKMYFYK